MRSNIFCKASAVWAIIIAILVLSACGSAPSAAAMTSSSAALRVLADGQIASTAAGTTLYGMTQAIEGITPGASIWFSPDNKLILFTWPVKEIGQAWAMMVNTSDGLASYMKSTGGRGSIANIPTWSNLRQYLEAGKWTVGSASTLATGLASSIQATYQAEFAAAVVAAGTTRTIPIPIIIMPTFTLLEMIDTINNFLFPQIQA